MKKSFEIAGKALYLQQTYDNANVTNSIWLSYLLFTRIVLFCPHRPGSKLEKLCCHNQVF